LTALSLCFEAISQAKWFHLRVKPSFASTDSSRASPLTWIAKRRLRLVGRARARERPELLRYLRASK